ncbi:hypothetical protein A2Z23_00875 [Candidatus Curtissbacteria bacterium RBG_16_39_7]|uniref:TrpR like protein, YerC/YecD n=1 Tax=Candidatus Curtissbacteria bacterium RBG_16_39_7 TaxID=1797707 RepID=A0A1F5G1W0_9BACT|nr:MAG: hypothetical protein A2Z23_00875 [Candidatus Curtissbacteria bacterium RBG_16_39_7]
MTKPQDIPRDPNFLAEVEFLYQVLFQTIENPDDCKSLLKDLLTDSELRMIQNRWRVARFLDEGKSIRDTAAEAGVGTDTVERIAKRLSAGAGGLQKALEIIRTPKEKGKSQERAGYKKEQEEKTSVPTLGRWVFGAGKK